MQEPLTDGVEEEERGRGRGGEGGGGGGGGADGRRTNGGDNISNQLGRGVIARVQLTTIENAHWGVEAGITADITFVFLSRVEKWESLLSPEFRALVTPSGIITEV